MHVSSLLRGSLNKLFDETASRMATSGPGFAWLDVLENMGHYHARIALAAQRVIRSKELSA